jgi:protein subunit release factor A
VISPTDRADAVLRNEAIYLNDSPFWFGHRTEKIRTYNFPDDCVTDHRAGLSVYVLSSVLSGQLDPLIDAYRKGDPDQEYDP